MDIISGVELKRKLERPHGMSPRTVRGETGSEQAVPCAAS